MNENYISNKDKINAIPQNNINHNHSVSLRYFYTKEIILFYLDMLYCCNDSQVNYYLINDFNRIELSLVFMINLEITLI